MLAATLKGAVSQRLVPTVDGNGRVAAAEILVVTGRVQDLILNPNETGKISQVIAEGEYYGMQTFDQSLLKHVAAGTVTEEVAMAYASSPHDFKLMIASAGKNASDIGQLLGDSDEEPEADVDGELPVATPTRPAREPDPEPVAAGAPASPGSASDIDYGSPEHAYGRGSAVAEASEAPPAGPPEAGAEDGGEDAEYGSDDVGLGSAEYAEIWDRPEQ
jgi:hypothetical protein